MMGGSGQSYLSKSEEARKVYDIMKSCGGMTCRELSERTGMTSMECQTMLRRLSMYGLVHKVGRTDLRDKRHIWAVRA